MDREAILKKGEEIRHQVYLLETMFPDKNEYRLDLYRLRIELVRIIAMFAVEDLKEKEHSRGRGE